MESMAKTKHGNGVELRGSVDKLTENGTRGSDPEANGNAMPGEVQVDKYGFTGGAQQVAGGS